MAHESGRPNIILIMTDQQRYDSIGALGYPYVDTPNLDRLAAEGVSFSNCHVAAAECVPSRASLFTGYYPHTTGIFVNQDTWRHSWIERLAAGGYHCVNVGKMHTQPFLTPMGFHERYVVENKDHRRDRDRFYDEWDKALRVRGLEKPQRETYRLRPDFGERMGAFAWDLPEEMHSDFFVGDMATWWIETLPKTEPLFLQIGFPGPHPPYDPIPRYVAPYLERELPIQGLAEGELAGQPPALLQLREDFANAEHDGIAHLLDPTPEQLHRVRAHYLANVTMIDEKIGQILQALERRGLLDNAVVIFTSDHGDCLGDHGHIQKWTMYDIITRVPLIVWAPGRFPAGLQVDALCQQMDIASAILKLAGVPAPQTWQAEPLMPALGGEPYAGRPYVFAEQGRGLLRGTPFMTMVRERDWKLVHLLDQPFGQLFDLRNDPQEVHNLWSDPAAASKKSELLDVLCEWQIRSAIETHDWGREWR